MNELSHLEILLLMRHYHWGRYTLEVEKYPHDQVEEAYEGLAKKGLVKLNRVSYKLTERGASYYQDILKKGGVNGLLQGSNPHRN